MDGGTRTQTSATRRVIPVKPASAAALAPYGHIVGRLAGAATGQSAFYGGAVTIAKPAAFKSDEDTCLSLVTIQPRPFEVSYLERHYKHTQTFLPLGGKPWVAIFGAPTSGDMPDFDRLEAFRFDGTSGFCMHVGTWHEFPFAIEADTDVVVILRNETNRNLDNIKDNEASGPDLDKKDILQRTGTIFELKL
jgi:ureidoglycolate lyase